MIKKRGGFAKNIFVVTSGKGGVGKSTVAVNIASVLAQRDFQVGILDADVYGPSIPRMLQVDQERLQWNEQNKIIPSENFGIKIMSVGLTTPRSDTPLIWRSSVATSAMIQLIDDVDWGDLDYLIIDMPPGTGDSQLTMTQELQVTGAIVVTTPQTIATDDVRRAINMLKEIKIPISGIIENMSYFQVPGQEGRHYIFGKQGGQMLADEYQIPFLGEIPIDMDIRQNSDEGFPISSTGNAIQKNYFASLADKIFIRETSLLGT
jgi:ATP-binding protein involved in chromosome partitioning